MTDGSYDLDALIEEGAAYFVRLQGAPKSRRYRKALSTWIARSEDHAKAMDLVCRLWVTSKEAAPPLAISSPRLSTWLAHAPGFRLAAGFGAVAAALCAVALNINTHKIYNNPSYNIERVSPFDGITVFMGPHTEIALDSSLLNRNIYIYKGIADIAVNHAFQKPRTFVRGFQIKDLGTRFIVSNDPDQASVTLISGEAAILDAHTGKELSRLKPGNTMTWGVLADRRTTMLQDTYRSIAWEDHVIEFEDTPLPEAIEQLRRFTGLKIRLNGAALSQLKISGTFNYDNPNNFFSALSTIYGANITRIKPNEYVIKM